MEKMYVQYGCGLCAPKEWINFDISFTLRIQKLPFLGKLLKNKLSANFPTNVRYGDIVKGLPLDENICDGLYCSHTLEHLSLQDFRTALNNSYKVLKKGGVFRCIVPDLEAAARRYLKALDDNNNLASIIFVGADTHLGVEKWPKNPEEILRYFVGSSGHLWMWDNKSLLKELKDAGFTNVRACKFDDSADKMFKYVESEERFESAVAFECIK